MYTKKGKKFKLVGLIMIAITLICYAFIPMVGELDSAAQAMRYNEDNISGNSAIVPRGEGVVTEDDRHIYYDYRVENNSNRIYTAPSYGNTNNTLTNACGPVAGTNIVGYYDRWHPNLIPNFIPGMINYGKYEYFPHLDFPAIESTIQSMYNIMGTNKDGPGTSKTDFLSGLKKSINNSGYNISYTSFTSNAKNVNLNQLSTAIANNKVGVIFCNTFNYVYDICDDSSGKETIVIKVNSTAAHIMMVYGFRTIAYYKNGINFQTDTYLQVSSGFSTADKGYVLLNDYLNIIDAVIVNVS